jgi:hypothetical protein
MYQVWWKEDKGGRLVTVKSEPMSYEQAQELADRLNANDPGCGAYVAPA